MTPESLNLPGDIILGAFVALVAAVPVLLLRGLYRRQRRALLTPRESLSPMRTIAFWWRWLCWFVSMPVVADFLWPKGGPYRRYNSQAFLIASQRHAAKEPKQ